MISLYTVCPRSVSLEIYSFYVSIVMVTFLVSENDLEVENGPSSHPPVLQLHPTNIYIVPRNNIPVPSNRTPSCSGVIYPQPHPPPHPATLQLNNMVFISYNITFIIYYLLDSNLLAFGVAFSLPSIPCFDAIKSC